mmetsp:Transcript_80889/g.212345  ORF Transcript_80889/g.212345 Transcript_80889/m.212345 type:complete len:293 (+) Transcript_80889:92-970(+)
MSLHCPCVTGSRHSLKDPPMAARSCGDIQPNSPHMIPPFFAVSHSDSSRQSSANFLVVKVTISMESLGGFLHAWRSERMSPMARRSMASASRRVRATFACFGCCEGCGPSLYLTRMCRSLTLLVPAVTLAFFAGGGRGSGPTPPICRNRSLSDGRSGKKHNSTTVHCTAVPAPAPRTPRRWAFVAISPHAARGCLGNSRATFTSSCGVRASATAEEAMRRRGCSALPLTCTACTSGWQVISPSAFHERSPKDRLTGDSRPLVGWRIRASAPWPTTKPPEACILFASLSMSHR